MSQTKTQLVEGLNINTSAPATALQIDASGNINLDSNTLYVDATNNRVGLGTSSPDNKLSVGIASADEGIELKATYNGSRVARFALLNPGVDNTPYIGSVTGNDFGFITSGTRRMTLTSTGKLGIGTTGPLGSLVVSNSGAEGLEIYPAFSSGLNMQFHYNRSGAVFVDSQSRAATHQFYINNSEQARIDSSGRLLVGTSTARSNYTGLAPQLQLESTGVDGSRFSITRNANSNGSGGLFFGKSRGTSNGSNTIVQSDDRLGSIDFFGADGTNFVGSASIAAEVDGTPGANDMPGRLVFSTNPGSPASSPTERMRISNTGRVSISHSNNTNVLLLEQTATSGFTSNVFQLGIGSSPNNTTTKFIYAGDSTTVRFEARSNGGIANYSANNVNLSDRNAKKDIVLAAGTWNCLKEWEIVNFRYRDQPDDAALNMGVIAQQVAESCPEVVTVFQEATEDEPEKLGVKDQQMMWMAIKALQEAQLRIETLETEVAALKGA